jgi:hypothetical protein
VGRAQYHRYRYFGDANAASKAASPRLKGGKQAPSEPASIHVVHCALPTAADVAGLSREDAVGALAKAFAASFREMAGSGRLTLRLAPPATGHGPDSNAFAAASLPSVTAEALACAFSLAAPSFSLTAAPEVAAAAGQDQRGFTVELCVEDAPQAFAAAVKEVQRAALAQEWARLCREVHRQEELYDSDAAGIEASERCAASAKAVVDRSAEAWAARSSEVTELRNMVRSLGPASNSTHEARDEQASALAALARSTDAQETARATLQAARERLIEVRQKEPTRKCAGASLRVHACSATNKTPQWLCKLLLLVRSSCLRVLICAILSAGAGGALHGARHRDGGGRPSSPRRGGGRRSGTLPESCPSRRFRGCAGRQRGGKRGRG